MFEIIPIPSLLYYFSINQKFLCFPQLSACAYDMGGACGGHKINEVKGLVNTGGSRYGEAEQEFVSQLYEGRSGMAVHDIRGTSLRSTRLYEGTALVDIQCKSTRVAGKKINYSK